MRIWVLVGCAVTFCVVCNAGARKFMSSRVSIFLGEISFPLYLLHSLIIRVVGTPLLAKATSPVKIAVADGIVVIVALLVAWWLLERSHYGASTLPVRSKILASARMTGEAPIG